MRGDEVINWAERCRKSCADNSPMRQRWISGIVFEDKGYSFALHYRKAAQHAERLRHHIAAARAAFPGEATELLLGKAMFEVKRPGISKGDSGAN